MVNRRSFIKQISAAGIAGCLPGTLAALPGEVSNSTLSSKVPSPKIWACLMHMSFNFASGIWVKGDKNKWGSYGLRKEFEPQYSLWSDAVKRMTDTGINMVILNLDDAIIWHSHPEIAQKNAWTPERLRKELKIMRDLGIEPIPMLNFSTCHDQWMGKYDRMVSTPTYYKVCRDLIDEAIQLFDTPRFIHFGMDEERPDYQSHFDYAVVRQKDLWWGDLYFYFAEALSHGVRPWVWADAVWDDPETFFKMMPKSAIQSNWYYGVDFDEKHKYVKAYIDLEREGYDQIPTGSNDQNLPKNIGKTVDFCSKRVADQRLMGFMQTLWMPTIEKYRPPIIQGIELLGEARAKFEKR